MAGVLSLLAAACTVDRWSRHARIPGAREGAVSGTSRVGPACTVADRTWDTLDRSRPDRGPGTGRAAAVRREPSGTKRNDPLARGRVI